MNAVARDTELARVAELQTGRSVASSLVAAYEPWDGSRDGSWVAERSRAAAIKTRFEGK